MERSASYSSQGGRIANGYDDHPSPLPPWEQRNMARVPYMSGNAQPLSETERHALQSLWAANGSEKPATTRPGLRGHGQRSFDNGYPLPRQGVYMDHGLPTPKSAPPFTAPRPSPPLPMSMSRHPQRFPQAPQSATHPPPFTAMPPTPPPEHPTNLSRSSTKSSISSIKKSISISSPGHSPRLPQVLLTPPLPGTMSARDSVVPPKQPPPRPEREEREDRPVAKKEKPIEASKPLGMRLKLAMKDLFKREPIDESQFERIADRHWTEE